MKKMPYPYTEQSVLSELEVLKHKLTFKGHSADLFLKKGNGIRTLLKETGRLSDFKGLFVLSSHDGRVMFVKESDSVLSEIQKTVRGKREKDKDFLQNIAQTKDFKNTSEIQEYLKTLEVKWIEVFDKNKRIALYRAVKSINFI